MGEASAVNVLLNPGFELGSDADATDWEQFGGPAGSTTRSDAMPNTGDFSLYLEVDHVNNTPSAVAYFAQQVQPVGSIDSSRNYDLSFSAKVDTLDFEGIDLFYQLQWLDQDASDGGGVQGETLVSLIPAGINTSYQTFGLSDIDVPDGADSFLLRFQLSPGPIPDIANGLSIDDASLSVSGGVSLAADFNGDGTVDLLDLDILGTNFAGIPSRETGDANGDGVVNLLDLDILGQEFGMSVNATSTPEPTSALLAGLALTTGLVRRRAYAMR